MRGTIAGGSVTVNRNPWRTDKPPVGHVVEVWLLTAVVSRASERNERQADPIRRLQAENDALRAGEGVTLRIVVERVGPEEAAAGDVLGRFNWN